MVTSIKGNATSTFGGQIVTPAPAFSAYQSSAQSVSSATWTKVQLQTEEYDLTNAFDSTTNYQFQPTVAGYYQMSGAVTLPYTASASKPLLIVLRKNAGLYKYGSRVSSTGVVYPTASMSALVYLNGSTDYVDLYTYQQTGGAVNLSAGIADTYFQAVLARAV